MSFRKTVTLKSTQKDGAVANNLNFRGQPQKECDIPPHAHVYVRTRMSNAVVCIFATVPNSLLLLLAIHHFLMLAQIRPECKGFVTLAAFERLGVRVSLHMCPEI